MPLWLHTTTDKAQHLVEQTSNSETQINILWYENEINFNGIFYCFTICKRPFGLTLDFIIAIWKHINSAPSSYSQLIASRHPPKWLCYPYFPACAYKMAELSGKFQLSDADEDNFDKIMEAVGN